VSILSPIVMTTLAAANAAIPQDLRSVVCVSDGSLGPVVVVEHEDAVAHVSLYGAQLLRFAPKSMGELLYLSPKAEARGRSIRGGVPVCFPWFADRRNDPHPGGRPSPSHGLVRTKPWELVDVIREDNSERIALTFAYGAHPADATWFASSFAASVIVRIGATAEVRLVVDNPSSESLRFEAALHTYFSVGDVAAARIHGLQASPAYDKIKQAPATVVDATVACSGPLDLVCASTNSVVLDDGARRIRIDKGGSTHTVLWNPGAAWAAKLTDVPLGDWQRFICVEAAAVHPSEVEVPPGGSHELWQRITPMVAGNRA
jgi:glucose-6-phosphate 1-epimerase